MFLSVRYPCRALTAFIETEIIFCSGNRNHLLQSFRVMVKLSRGHDNTSACREHRPFFKNGFNQLAVYSVSGMFGMVGCFRCRTSMAHIRQSRPDSGLGCRVKILNTV